MWSCFICITASPGCLSWEADVSSCFLQHSTNTEGAAGGQHSAGCSPAVQLQDLCSWLAFIQIGVCNASPEVRRKGRGVSWQPARVSSESSSPPKRCWWVWRKGGWSQLEGFLTAAGEEGGICPFLLPDGRKARSSALHDTCCFCTLGPFPLKCPLLFLYRYLARAAQNRHKDKKRTRGEMSVWVPTQPSPPRPPAVSRDTVCPWC